MKEEKKRRRKDRGGGVTEAHYVPTTGHAYVNRNTKKNKRRLHTRAHLIATEEREPIWEQKLEVRIDI